MNINDEQYECLLAYLKELHKGMNSLIITNALIAFVMGSYFLASILAAKTSG